MPENLAVHEIPSGEVRIVPSSPATTNVPLPCATPFNACGDPVIRFVQLIPLVEDRTVPFSPTATNTPLPKPTPYKLFVVSELTALQASPFDEIRIVARPLGALAPTPTNNPFPNTIPESWLSVPEA